MPTRSIATRNPVTPTTARPLIIHSRGVVDDTCDVVVQAALVVEGIRLQAQARVIVGPPFCPRSPSVCIISGRFNGSRPGRFAEEEPLVDAQHRVNDLFQQALEVAGLFNLDANRDRGIQTNGPNPPQLPGSHAPTAPA